MVLSGGVFSDAGTTVKQQILLRTDNTSTLQAALEHRASSPLLVALAAEIALSLEVRQLMPLWGQHVPGSLNVIADKLSRLSRALRYQHSCRTASVCPPQDGAEQTSEHGLHVEIDVVVVAYCLHAYLCCSSSCVSSYSRTDGTWQQVRWVRYGSATFCHHPFPNHWKPWFNSRIAISCFKNLILAAEPTLVTVSLEVVAVT